MLDPFPSAAAVALCGAWAFIGCAPAPTCAAGSTQQCLCPDGASGAQNCADDGVRWLECSCLGSEGEGEGEGEEPSVLPLGLVTPTTQQCGSDGPGALVGTTCQRLDIDCDGLATAQVTLRVSPHTSGVTRRGTVVLGTGGQGVRWYEREAEALSMAQSLRDSGFWVVQRKWRTGWITGEASLPASACRYASLITWINENYGGSEQAFCVSGNSGGSTEIAYALTRYGREQIIDLAMPTGGPPMGRVDLGCADPVEVDLSTCKDAIIPDMDCRRYSCTYDSESVATMDAAYSDTPCADHDVARLLPDSIVSPEADLSYPQTVIRFVYGEDDCGTSIGLGRYYHDAITSEKERTIARNTPHRVFATVEGNEAIRQAMVNDCLFRH